MKLSNKILFATLAFQTVSIILICFVNHERFAVCAYYLVFCWLTNLWTWWMLGSQIDYSYRLRVVASIRSKIKPIRTI